MILTVARSSSAYTLILRRGGGRLWQPIPRRETDIGKVPFGTAPRSIIPRTIAGRSGTPIQAGLSTRRETAGHVTTFTERNDIRLTRHTRDPIRQPTGVVHEAGTLLAWRA